MPDRTSNSKAGTHCFLNKQGIPFGAFEVYWWDACRGAAAGWYWTAYEPVRLKNKGNFGPFPTSAEAWANANRAGMGLAKRL